MPPTRPVPRAAALVAAALILVAGVTCTEGPTGPRKSGVYALVGMSPVFSQAATKIYRQLASFELEIDNIRIRLERENGEVAVDTVVAITAGQDSIVIKLSVEILEGTQEQFEATLEFRDGTQVLFSGTQTITATLGFAPPPVPSIIIEYTGPGATVATLDVQPDTTISGLDDIQMRAIGRDANEQVVANLNLEWSVDNANLGAISTTGVFNPTGTSGTATITAELPTGIQASATVTIASPPTAVVLISGGGQTGPVGATLELPIVVEVRRADGSAVAGHSVSFAITAGGGSVAPPSATTAANGRANAFLTLGTAPGTNTVQVTAAGLSPITVSATANTGPLHHILIVQQPSTSATSGQVLAVQPKVNLNDAFGNDIAQANVAITADLNPAAGYTLQGTTTRLTNASGIAEFTDLNISGPDGVTALRFSTSGVASVTSQNIFVAVAGPSIVTWTNASGGNWSTGSNWSTGVAPTSSEHAVIDMAGTYTVTLDANVTVAALTVGGGAGAPTLTGAARTLSVTGAIDVGENGTLNLTTNSSLAGSGALTNQGTIILTNSTTFASMTINNHGTLVLRGTTLINGPLVTSGASMIRVEGSNAGSHAAVTVAAGFTNNGQLELTSVDAGYSAVMTVTNGTLVNGPTATITSATGAGGARTLVAQLDNQGTVVVQQALSLSKADADHVNRATLDLTTANLTVSLTGTTPTFTNTSTGAIAVGTNQVLSLSGGAIDLSAGVVTGAVNARAIVTGATLAFSPATVLLPLTLGTTTIAGGSVTVATGQTLTLYGGLVSDPVTIQTGGTLVALAGGTLSGALTLAQGGTLRVRGQNFGSHAALTIADGFTNDGLIELTSVDAGYSATLTVTNNTLTNAAGATIRSAPGAGGSRTIAAQLHNAGLVDVDQPLSLDRAGADHINTGTLDLTTANLTITQSGSTPSFTNSETIILGASRTLTVSGGAVDLSTGIVSGQLTSTLVVTGASLAFSTSTVAIPMTLTTTTIVGGAVTIPADETLTLLHGGLTDPVTVQAGGTLLTHGTVALTTLNLPTSTSLLRVRGQNNGSHATLTVANEFANNGLIELTSADAGYASTLTVTTGTLTNAEGATIRSLVGDGGSRTLAAQLVNNGTLDVDQPLTLSRADADHQNTATIDLTNANLTVTQTGTTPSFTHFGGTVMLGANRTWTVTGGELSIGEALVTGQLTSTLVVSGATLGFTTNAVLIPMTLTSTTIIGGAVNIPSGETLTLLNGGLTDPVTVQAGGTLLTHGTVSLTSIALPAATSTLRVQGQNNGSHATLTVVNGFTNSGLIELTSADAGYSATLAVTNGQLENALGATIRAALGDGGGRTLAAQIYNYGTLDVDQALTLDRASSDHYNSNLIDLTNANLTVNQTGDTPSFGNGYIGIMRLGTNRQFIVNGGSLNLTGSSLVEAQSGHTNPTLVVNNAVLQFTPPRVTIPMTLTNTTILGGSVTVTTGQTVTLLNGGLSDAVNLSGGTLLALGNVSLTGTVSITSGSTLRVRGQNFGSHATLTHNNAAGLTNSGVIELTSADAGYSATLNVLSGTLTNATGATFLVDPGSGGARTIGAEVNNQGYLEANADVTISRNGANHVNNSIIAANGGNITVSQSGGSFTNLWQVNLSANRSMTVLGGLLDVDQGAVNGGVSSTLIVTDATMAFNPLNVHVPMTLTGTSIPGGVTLGVEGVMTLLNGGLTDAVTVVYGGLLNVHGSVSLTSLAIEGGTVMVQGQTIGSHATLTVANGFTNNGFIELTSIDAGYTATLAVTNGALTNGAGASIRSTAGTGGGRILAAQLNNQGLVEVYQALTINKPSAQHTNAANSTITLYDGDLTIAQSGTGQSFSNSGTIDLQGNTLINSGGPFDNNLADAMAIVGPGTLNVGTTFLNNGSVRPNGTLNITGNYPQTTPSGNLDIQISPSQSSSCEVSHQLVATGAASLAGGLNVFLNDCVLTNNQTFTILTAASRTGTFSYTPINIQGGVLNIEYTPTQAILRFIVP